MRAAFAALALSCLLATPALAQRSGTYAVEGAGADGSRYQGTAQLQATGPKTWSMTWRVAGDTSTGTGLLESGLLVIGYLSNRETGVAIYAVQPDGSLLGMFTQGKDGEVGSERLLPR